MNIRCYNAYISYCLTKYFCCRKSTLKKLSLFPLFFLLTTFVISFEFYPKQELSKNPSASYDVTSLSQSKEEEYIEKSTNILFIQTSIIQSNESRSIHENEKVQDGNNEVYFSLDGTERNQTERRKRESDHSFGRRPFGPLSKYEYPTYRGHVWVAYFLEESLVPVLQNKDKIMVDCTVIELRSEEEQIEALKVFGSLMELVPISLTEMIHLIKICGELPRNRVEFDYGNTPSESSGSRRSSFILPGTLWCGIRDRAPRYENLGQREKLDNCCRGHDHCPLKVGSFEDRYGLRNVGFGTKSHCLCDNEFFRCLKEIGSEFANMIGNFYFDVLRVECLQPSEGNVDNEALLYPAKNLYYCENVDEYGRCRYWKKREVTHHYKSERFKYSY